MLLTNFDYFFGRVPGCGVTGKNRLDFGGEW